MPAPASSEWSGSIKHHYLPEFYLSRWMVPADQPLCEFSRQNGVIKPKRVFPSATGFRKHLYSLEGLSGAEAQIVEDKFMSKVDSLAAQALDRLETGDTLRENAKLRTAWARFVLSLVLRSPADVKILKEDYLAQLLVPDAELEAAWAKQRGPADPLTIQDYLAADPDMPKRNATRILQKLIDHKNILPSIMRMRWAVIETDNTGWPMTTSDRPVVASDAMVGRNGHILMAMGPSRIFVATMRKEKLAEIWKSDWRLLAEQVSAKGVGQAENYAYASDDRHIAFVRQHIFRYPERSQFTRLAEKRGSQDQ